MQQQTIAPNEARRVSRRKVLIIVAGVAAALLLYFSSLTILSSMQLLDFGPSKGTISYAPDQLVAGQQIDLGAGQSITTAAFSPDGALAATGGNGVSIELRRLPGGERVGTLDAGDRPQTLLFSPDSRIVLAASSTTIRVWNAANSQPLYAPLQANMPLKVVMISADGQRIYAAGTDGTLLVWQLSNGQRLLIRTGKLPALNDGATWSEDGRLLAYADASRGVVLWSLEKEEEQYVVAAQPNGRIVNLAFSHLGGLLASQDESGQVQIFRTQTGELVHTFRWAGQTAPGVAPISTSSFSADARLFVLGGNDGRIELWDAQKGELRATIDASSASVRDLGFSDDGTTMSAATEDGNVRLWHAAPSS